MQRSFQKARREHPELDLWQVLDKLLAETPAEPGSQIAKQLHAQKIKYITIYDEDYPPILKNLTDPPFVIFYSGRLSNLHRPAVSVVGARSCTEYGLQATRLIAGELARFGFVVVSGLALGIDAQAHQSALDVQGRTVAVLGSGFDQLYPKAHSDLARQIVRQQGTVITEFPPGHAPKPFHFPFRNRIIAGLSHACVVVEAKARSGSLSTARHCLDQGRELFAVPGPIHHPSSMGTHGLIAAGEAHIFLSMDHMLEHLAPALGMAAACATPLLETIEDPIAKAIYDRLDALEATPLDEVVAQLEITAAQAAAALIELEERNLVTEKPGQMLVRNPLISPVKS